MTPGSLPDALQNLFVHRAVQLYVQVLTTQLHVTVCSVHGVLCKQLRAQATAIAALHLRKLDHSTPAYKCTRSARLDYYSNLRSIGLLMMFQHTEGVV